MRRQVGDGDVSLLSRRVNSGDMPRDGLVVPMQAITKLVHHSVLSEGSARPRTTQTRGETRQENRGREITISKNSKSYSLPKCQEGTSRYAIGAIE